MTGVIKKTNAVIEKGKHKETIEKYPMLIIILIAQDYRGEDIDLARVLPQFQRQKAFWRDLTINNVF